MTATLHSPRAERTTPLNRALGEWTTDERAVALAASLAQGGDARIALDPETGLNRYLSAPYPRDVLAYSSSTISDISPEAFAHVLGVYERIAGASYDETLAALRGRIGAALGLNASDAQIVFAPSGTDLEYVALACVTGRSEGGVHNILLGADETGSGCIHSAHGRYFAGETALGHPTIPATPVEGCGPISLIDVKVRCPGGVARSSAEVSADMEREIEAARARGAHALVHAVHGSKTGLVLPVLADMDRLLAKFGPALTFVVDACQARITSSAIAAYLEGGCIVAMTGSKFIGAPPFNGWALVPPGLVQSAAPLPEGFSEVFRRAEWPERWPGREDLDNSANLSLALRLEAALFELERFQAIPMERIEAIIDAFEQAVATHLIEPLGLVRVCPGPTTEGAARPIEMRTLITLDVSSVPGLATFEQAQAFHRQLALGGIRLGQPVKCVATEEGWGGTLRVGLSMPQMIRWAALSQTECADQLSQDMQRIAQAIERQVEA